MWLGAIIRPPLCLPYPPWLDWPWPRQQAAKQPFWPNKLCGVSYMYHCIYKTSLWFFPKYHGDIWDSKAKPDLLNPVLMPLTFTEVCSWFQADGSGSTTVGDFVHLAVLGLAMFPSHLNNNSIGKKANSSIAQCLDQFPLHDYCRGFFWEPLSSSVVVPVTWFPFISSVTTAWAVDPSWPGAWLVLVSVQVLQVMG